MKDFPELSRILNIIDLAKKFSEVEVRTLASVSTGGREFPIFSFNVGSKDKSKPTLGLFGGVHGLERIGTQCVLAYFESLFEQMQWDKDLHERLKDVRIVSIPLINPSGMFFGTRSNSNGVDLMRNAPVEASEKPAWLVGGHRLSAKLPWYRGPTPGTLELEADTLINFVREEMFGSEAALVLDCHSGFGLKDRLWYPYARTTDPFPQLHYVQKLKDLLDRSYPNHVYLVEPQSLSYTTHGDLWDYMFDEHRTKHGSSNPLFIPWTLEMGSWMWVRKNPLQLFSSLGHFNPVKGHRYKRTLRRHMPLFDFLLRATKNYKAWL